MSRIRSRHNLAPGGAGLMLVAAVVVMLAGCEQPPQRVWDDSAMARERFSGQGTPSALFLPEVATMSSAPSDRSVQLPPMEMFNYRADWPAAAGYPMGEVTFYRERIYDRQHSSTSGRGHIYNHLNRYFEVYRTGVLVK